MFYKVDFTKVNYLRTPQGCYFLHKFNDNQIQFLKAECPHKGGPLYLGKYDSNSKLITCPWHEKKISIQYLKSTAPPYIRNSSYIRIFIPILPCEVYLCYKQNIGL